jgi:hypothetical protein
MPPDFPSYSRDELDEHARNLLRTRRRGIDLGVGSDYDLWSRILGALAWGEQKWAESAFLLLDRRRAYGAFLDAYMLESGIGRDVTETSAGATRATGYVILCAPDGDASQVQPAGSVLRHADGTEFTLDANATTLTPAVKTLYVGHLSTKSRLYQGHLGSGFTTVLTDEIYMVSGTGELCAVKGADNHTALARYLVDLYNPLDALPALHDTLVRRGGAVARVTAVKAGLRGNKAAKERLTLLSPAGTMLSEAYVLTLSGGADAMTPAECQAALASLFGQRAPVGTFEELRALARSCPLVALTDCYVTPATGGLGTYTLLPVRPEGAFAGAFDRALVLEHVRARMSPDVLVEAASVYEALDTRIDVLSVQVSAIYRPDWQLPDESVAGIAIDAATPTTLTLDVAPPLAVGNRVVITTRGTAGPYLVVRRVTGLAGLTITVDPPLPFPPDVGDSFVTPGGALAERIIGALYAAYGARAPSVEAGALRYPPAGTSDDVDALVSAISRVEGVLDVALIAGAEPDLAIAGGTLVPQCVLRMYA